ncbi:MAG TPA: riboflavin synthase [Deltaproteobacteria bacterium]|nr:riboflavin synthase [Deltaproteobacteria bacterium]
MFTGIIETIGTITRINKKTGKWEFFIKIPLQKEAITEGESLSIDGVCLTVVSIDRDIVCVDASLETLKVTTLNKKTEDMNVNIERSLKADGRFGGHFVTGHVDCTGTIVEIQRKGDSIELTIEVPSQFSRYIVVKGSIAVDGISLTVNSQRDNKFTVNIIPYTASHTTILNKHLRDNVNIETDIIGKYMDNFIRKENRKGIDLDFLHKYGFTK